MSAPSSLPGGAILLWAVLWPGPVASGAPRSDLLKNPRFIAVRSGSRITFSCSSSSEVSWYKEDRHGSEPQELGNTSRIRVASKASVSTIHISKLQPADSGTYFCWGRNEMERLGRRQHCGTGVRILGTSTYQQVQDRNTMKDTIILIQSVLLFLFIGFPLLMLLGKGNEKEVPGEDHTYEGLAVELVDTYEDIGTYQEKAEEKKRGLGEPPSEE